MQWDPRLKLEDYYVAAAPLGGPIALARKAPGGDKIQTKPLIFIFSSAGEKISSFKVCPNWLLFRITKFHSPFE